MVRFAFGGRRLSVATFWRKRKPDGSCALSVYGALGRGDRIHQVLVQLFQVRLLCRADLCEVCLILLPETDVLGKDRDFVAELFLVRLEDVGLKLFDFSFRLFDRRLLLVDRVLAEGSKGCERNLLLMFFLLALGDHLVHHLQDLLDRRHSRSDLVRCRRRKK